ncbi:hypothetical protein BDV96DRAFT_589944 [Lophiotrema nucula]|uniref:Uncharacterized protein n=1 Tax=Lophiotrema nucula TaxID=690887 RepID=A0A6A5YLY5_9PLEO|nr:hypothetical protein BDV96DRAFT_589944 [Lophiotrema nucula]
MTKLCTLCETPRQTLVRCQIDESQKWHFVCPGKCWKSVSGGTEDARGLEEQYPYYRYGGMRKDRSADGPVNAKKSRKVKARQRDEMGERKDISALVNGRAGENEGPGHEHVDADECT